jgi:hypothetical protein
MRKIYVISPVKLKEEEKNFLEKYVDNLEKNGYDVYWPLRDVNQNFGELETCYQNKKAIIKADEIHIYWDPESEEIKFDLGMMFILLDSQPKRKFIRLINKRKIKRTPYKSLENLLILLEKHYGRI